jgi:hypothetical protein
MLGFPDKLPPSTLMLWGLTALVALVAMALIVAYEGRHFRKLGLGSPWLKLRVATLPIMALTIAAMYGTFVATGVRGMEGLAVAYLVLLTVGPLVYFGLHWLVGRMAGLSRGVSAWIAFSGLLIAGMPPAIGGMLMQTLGAHLHAMRNRPPPDTTPEAPSPYTQAAARRLVLPDKFELWAVHWQAPAGIRVSRVALETQGVRVEDVSRGDFSTLCVHGGDVHLLWPAERPIPTLQVYWKDASGTERRSTWTVRAPAAAVETFEPAWRETEVVLPVAVPKGVLALLWARPGGGSPIGDTVQQSEPGSTCAPQRIALKEKHDFGLPYELKMRVDHAMPIAPNFVSFSRPAPAGD